MNITLTNFQLRAIAALQEAMRGDKREIVLKSCTGSGKTIILTHFIDEYIKSNAKSVFVWLTPGKGNLEEQSKAKMDTYVYGRATKLIEDVMTGGFEEGDTCFINWERLTKKGNTALKDGERTNFLEHIEKALHNGLIFKIVVDESHQNETIKANEIIEYFKADKIIRSSATPSGYTDAVVIEVDEMDVIIDGLIKKFLVINQDFEQNIHATNQVDYLLTRAMEKQEKLKYGFEKEETDVNPLVIVQLPDKGKGGDVLLDEVERWFETKEVTYENKRLAVWLADKKENLERIEQNNAVPIALIIKQAVATGWDCPRAHILVKLRDIWKKFSRFKP